MKRTIAIFAALLLSLPLMGQENERFFRVGVDTSIDCFLSTNNRIAPSGGIGVRARLGRYSQWVNGVVGVRYIYGMRLSGIQVPVLVNVNVVRAEKVSAYLGAGYEFDFIGTYWGCMKFQTGVAIAKHFDIRVFYKPYQGDIGAGFTYYF